MIAAIVSGFLAVCGALLWRKNMQSMVCTPTTPAGAEVFIYAAPEDVIWPPFLPRLPRSEESRPPEKRDRGDEEKPRNTRKPRGFSLQGLTVNESGAVLRL
jgi:hypothetical protein